VVLLVEGLSKKKVSGNKGVVFKGVDIDPAAATLISEE
jgi:hypothetical protein